MIRASVRSVAQQLSHTQVRSRPGHWTIASSMTCCYRPDLATIRCRFRSATSIMGDHFEHLLW